MARRTSPIPRTRLTRLLHDSSRTQKAPIKSRNSFRGLTAIFPAAGASRRRRQASPLSYAGGFGEVVAESSGRARRREAASSVDSIATAIESPCVLASQRPSHPADEHYSAKTSYR